MPTVTITTETPTATSDTSCRCCCYCPEGMPLSYTLSGHLHWVDGDEIVVCDTDFSIQLDLFADCQYSGVTDDYCDEATLTFILSLTSEIDVDNEIGCGWVVASFEFGSSSFKEGRDDPIGLYPDWTGPAGGGGTITFTELAVAA